MPVLGGLFFLAAFLFMIMAKPAFGVPGLGTPSHRGMAKVLSCESSSLRLGMVDDCVAVIRWDDGWDGPKSPAGTTSFISARPISGSVPVEYFNYRRDRSTKILPVDRPRWTAGYGTYVFLTYAAGTVVGVGGGFLGYRFARLLPEPPVPVKKFRRGVDRRENPGFNGPRRRKRR